MVVIHPNYYQWWQAFRQASNEDEILAMWVPQCVNTVLGKIKPADPWTLVDVGAFGGKQALNVFQQANIKPAVVKLIEPSAQIEEAKIVFESAGIRIEPQICRKSVEECLEKLRGRNQLFMLVHSAYYISTGTLDRILQASDMGVLVIIDTLFSIFARVGKALNPQLWENLHHANVWAKNHGTCIGRKSIKISFEPNADLEDVYSFIALRAFKELSEKQQVLFKELCKEHLDESGYVVAETECWFCTNS